MALVDPAPIDIRIKELHSKKILITMCLFWLEARFATDSYEGTYTLKRSGAEKFDQNHFLVSCTRSIRLNFCILVQEGPTIPMHQIKHSEHIYIQVMKQHMP